MTTTEERTAPAPRLSRRRRVLGFVDRHPVAIMAVFATALAVCHAVWILDHRFVGGFDPDETGYLASAMRMQRSIDFLHPWMFLQTFAGTPNGPLVPLLSVPLLIVGTRSPLTAFMIQPILMVFTTVAVTATARRLTSSWVALLAGLVTLSIPSFMLATQSYWLGLGAAAAAAGAAWALVSSEGCTNRYTLWFGAALGAMLLARSMTLGFAPGFALAALVVRRPGRESRRRLIRAALLTLVIAGPWWAAQARSTLDYLLGYGYGERAGLFGSGGPWERLMFRWDRMAHDVSQPKFTILVVGLIGGLLIGAWKARRGSAPEGLRTVAGLAVVVAAGLAALVSTSNQGVWFELPIVVVGVAPAVWGVRRFGRWATVALTGVASGQLVLFTLTSLWLIPPEHLRAHYEDGFAQYDERFAFDRRDSHREAADEWAQINRSVVQDMRMFDPQADGKVVFTVSGNMQLFNSNSLALAAEIEGWGPRIWIPDTTDAEDTARMLTPIAERQGDLRVERILVIATHDFILFTPDRDVAEFRRQALDAGWVPRSTYRMPVEGRVTILRHVDNLDR